MGNAASLAQIRVIFAKPVTKVEALSGVGPQSVLGHFAIAPALRGHFVVLTPRMVGFVAEQALPLGTRVRVTLTSGLRDLAGDALSGDLAWTFETDPIGFRDLPQTKASDDEPTPQPVGLRPALTVRANAAVDPASLGAHATLNANGESVALTATLVARPTPYPGTGAAELFNPQLKDWTYRLVPQRDLSRATTYALIVAPGVEPAYGNLPTAQRFSGEIRTYGPLAVTGTPAPSSGGRFDNGDPAVRFSNPLDPKSVSGAVSISPAPASVRKLAFSSPNDPSTIAIDPYALDPDKTYTVTIAPSVKDVFGQTLGSQQTVTIRTGGFSPGAWAPTGVSVIPAGAPVDLDFYATNLPGNAYRAAYARVDPTAMLGGADTLSHLPAPSTWGKQTIAGARRNVQSVIRVPLQQQLGGPYGALAYGFLTPLDSNNSPSYYGIAQLTNLGVFAQWFPGRGTVLVQHLNDGAPVGGATVTVYRVNSSSSTPPQRCAQGTTDAAGEYDVTGTAVDACSAGANQSQGGPNLGFVVSQGADVATVTVWNWSGIYRFNLSGGWMGGAPYSLGTIFSDRQMYQPGERGQLTGIAYYATPSGIFADRNAAYKVTLSDPSNNQTPLGSVTTDAYGVWSLPISFSKQQALGYYTISATGSNGNVISGSLRVAEFKPPNFKLQLSLDKTNATAGQAVIATAHASYLFGAPLEGGTAHAYVTRDVATLQPKGWDDFSFGRQWFWPEQTPSFDTDVLQKDLPLDARGTTSLNVGVPSSLPFPMTYRVDMETTDVSHLSVSDSQSFLALPTDATIGLSSDFVATVASPMPVRVIVTDASGTAVAGRAVHVELQKMTFTSATQEVEGGENAQQAVRYDTVATADVTSADRPVAATLTPTDPGPYRIRANFAGAPSDASETDTQVFAFGAGQADWGLSDNTSVPVKLDKKMYAIGDRATALVAVPYSKADVYFSVLRGKTFYQTVLRGASGSVRIPFVVTSAMLPNAAVEALVVDRSGIVAPSPSTSGGTKGTETLSKIGMTGFEVDTADRYLTLTISPQQPKVVPGGSQRVSFTLRSKQGTPQRGEIVAMAVDDAILQLSGYRLPDLVQTIFADQPISTIFADNRSDVVLKTQTAPLEKGYGYGGGYLAGAASTRVRQIFLSMAYYGRTTTDARGNASVSFTLPDNLTTWRVMAVAIGSDDMHFATGDATFIAAQPLITNPLLPQFARPGDRFDLGVAVSNQTGAAGALALVLQLSGALNFATGGQSQSVNEQASTGMQAFRFGVVAGTPAPTTFEARSTLGTQRDAFNVPVTISDRAVTDSVIESGATHAQTTVPVDLARGGSVRVTLANSIVPQFAVPSERAMSGDLLPLADEAASRLVIASALARLQGPYRLQLQYAPSDFIASSLNKLLGFQKDDGGFSECGATDSDPFVTAYALDALTFARAQGVTVPDAPISRATSYLSQTLANPARLKWCGDPLCKAQVRFAALWSLAQTGQRRSDFLADVVAQAPQFDSATQLRLARYLLQTPGWQSKGAAMADRLQQTLYVTGRYATANLSTPWAWLGSDVAAQAQMLQLLVQRHAPAEQLDGAVRALVAQQCRCGWPTSDQTATALRALNAYAATERLSPGSATLRIGSTTLATAQFGSTASSQTFSFAASALHGNALAVGSSGGTVHYTVLYTYPVPRDAPGELAAFRVIRTVAQPGPSASPLATMDLAPAQATTVAAGQVFDVGVRVIVDHPVDRLVIDDPLPAGFEAVDTSFRTTLQAVVPQSDSWDIDSQQIYRDRVVAYASHLGPGVYDVHYLVRSVTPGTFAWPGGRAYLQDAPEQFGRTAATSLTVSP